jgi:ParB family chromosome partitioning protein
MTDTASTDTTSVPLNKLVAWQGNVRKTGQGKALDELAASIAAHGLLQSLVVRKDKRNRYAVVAGHRRLLALTSLAEAGTIAADTGIPCHVIAGDANPTEISLAENAVREQMHPADEFEAFLALIEDGMRPADIAARFGVTESVVQQRLKLARVSPVIIEAYRKGELTLAHVMAFAAADDHGAQETAWEEMSDWQLEDPNTIREALTENEVTAKDRRVKFVTLKAYEKAGGAVRRDLFAQGEDGVFIQDIVLLESLLARKLEKAAKAVKEEGFKWIETRASFDHSEWAKCARRHPEPAPLSPDLQAELELLTKEYEALNNDDEGEDNPRLEEITARIEEIEDREENWTPETLAIAGAIVSIGYDGKAQIHRGYVKPEDLPKKTGRGRDAGSTEDSTGIPDEGAPGLSASLTESLTLHRTAALGAELMSRADIALAALVHTIAAQLFLHDASDDSCFVVRAPGYRLRGIEGTKASAVIATAEEKWGSVIPGTTDALWTWCLEQDRDTLLDLLAFCMARSVNAVQGKADRPGQNRLAHADRLAQSLGLDMKNWFTPTAENYFGRIAKTGILAAIREAKGEPAPAWEKAKKADLAAIAEREIAPIGWLPRILRSPADESDEAMADAA